MRFALLLVLVAGCYDPDVDWDAIHETPSDADIITQATLIPASPTGVDAAPTSPMTPDAPPANPPKTCAPGCAGTCDDGVCVISCVGNDACHDQVVCPLTGPCHVVCTGRKACNEGVRCGLGSCTVECNGDEACRKRVRCETSCACDVTCGPGACKEDAFCQRPWCEAGDGCTSEPDSCNSC